MSGTIGKLLRDFSSPKGQSNICACLKSEGKELVYKKRENTEDEIRALRYWKGMI